MLLDTCSQSISMFHRTTKIIAGLNNFNCHKVVHTVQAAELAGAHYVDIAANPDLIREVQKVSKIPICVSSIDIYELIECDRYNIHIIEVGNFDTFYRKGIFLNPSEILDMTKKLCSSNLNASLCVTIPHYLSLSEQVLLTKQLIDLGVNIIQTEGASTKSIQCKSFLGWLQQSSASLTSTYNFSLDSQINLVSSSGFNPLSAPIAIAYGASVVGVGSFLSCAQYDLLNVSLRIGAIIDSITINNTNVISSHKFFFHYNTAVYVCFV